MFCVYDEKKYIIDYRFIHKTACRKKKSMNVRDAKFIESYSFNSRFGNILSQGSLFISYLSTYPKIIDIVYSMC